MEATYNLIIYGQSKVNNRTSSKLSGGGANELMSPLSIRTQKNLSRHNIARVDPNVDVLEINQKPQTQA